MSPLRARLVAIVLGGVLASVASVARAEDVVVLTSGREIRGTVLDETDESVEVGIAGGSVWFARDRVAEIRRGTPADAKADAGAPRFSTALLYTDGERVGTRTLRHSLQGDGHQWEEHVVFLAADGLPDLEVHTLERSGADFQPRMFQVREASRGGPERMIRGEVTGTLLEVSETLRGETSKTVSDLRSGARFPFAARDEFVAERLDASSAAVFDLRDRRWRDVTYRAAGERVVEEAGRAVTVRVIERRRGEIREIEWVAPDGRALLADLNGPDLRALAASAEAVAAVSAGQPDRVFGTDSAARTRWSDPAEGFAIRKPDPSWLFERPAVPGGGALLSIRNAAVGASVDVLRDLAPPPDVTLERAGVALERVLRAVAPDLDVIRSGVVSRDGSAAFELEAKATTKGERTHTLARVLIVDGRVYRLLGACPAGRFDVLRGDFEQILDSFETE